MFLYLKVRTQRRTHMPLSWAIVAPGTEMWRTRAIERERELERSALARSPYKSLPLSGCPVSELRIARARILEGEHLRTYIDDRSGSMRDEERLNRQGKDNETISYSFLKRYVKAFIPHINESNHMAACIHSRDTLSPAFISARLTCTCVQCPLSKYPASYLLEEIL